MLNKLEEIARSLGEGKKRNRTTVRRFLSWYGAERRGQAIVRRIRADLDLCGLETDPDFENAWIDAPIALRLRNASTDAPNSPAVSALPMPVVQADDDVPSDIDDEARQLPEQQIEAPTGSEGVFVNEPKLEPNRSSPTLTIGNLDAAHKPITTVNRDDELMHAITLMLQYDFSQLPIMQGERELKGVISWRSICETRAMKGACDVVRDCREDAQVIGENTRFFDAIPVIIRHGYVLVRSTTNLISGIVTASDLAAQFQQMAEPFLLIREIELHVRRLLDGNVTQEEIGALGDGATAPAEDRRLDDLSFGEYVLLLQRPSVWDRVGLKVDKTEVTAQLDKVREIRNDVMHFDPDPPTAKEMDELKSASQFLLRLSESRYGNR